MPDALEQLRERIDTLDDQLLILLNQRAALALEIGALKKRDHTPIFHPERERTIFTRMQARNQGPLKEHHIAAIWREIMSASRALEKPSVVAFLGPEGTYTEQAMHGYFGYSVNGLSCPSIDAVFRAVESSAAHFGVAPIENSNEGVVSHTLDRLLHTPLMIHGEMTLPIHHHLLTRTGQLQGILSICAHAQALAQCQHWLAAHGSHLELRAVASNATAAQMAAADQSMAAIASERAAAHYGLKIAHAMIQDDAHNCTRFVVLSPASAPGAPSGCDQTSLILSVPNVPGAVYRMLEPFTRHRVSMTRFESRPAKSGAWEYYFYIDLAGHRADAPVAAALAELEQIVAFMKVLGAYPCGGHYKP